MKWLRWYENNKEGFARNKYGRGFASLTHFQIQELQDEMARVWIGDFLIKNPKDE